MFLISLASNPELYLIPGFSSSGSFWLVLLSLLLCWYHSVSYFFLLLIPVTILHLFHVFIIIAYVTLLISLQLCCICMGRCFSSSISVLIPLFFMLYFLSSSSYFSFLLMSPPWWRSKMIMCFLTSLLFWSFFSTRVLIPFYFYFHKLKGQSFLLHSL